MKKLDVFLLAVAMVLGMVSCGGGSTAADSIAFDPSGSEWQFLVTTASAGESMYTLSFFNSEGTKEASGLFTVVSSSGTSYGGSWAISGNVVTGSSSGSFSFTLTIDGGGATGTIDYVTAEGSGSAIATRTDTSAADCSQYAGTWAGTANETYCDGSVSAVALTMTVSNNCNATVCSSLNECTDYVIAGDGISATKSNPDCGTSTVVGSFTATTFSSSWQYASGGGGTATFTKQ